MVIHLGPSSGIDDHLQESGRVGRNNEKAHAVLLRYKGSTRSRNITKEMKEYTRNENICRRNLLLKSFTASPSQNPILLIHVVISVQKNVSVYVPVEPRNVCAKKKCKKSDHQSSFEKLLKRSVSGNKTTSCNDKSKLQGKMLNPLETIYCSTRCSWQVISQMKN